MGNLKYNKLQYLSTPIYVLNIDRYDDWNGVRNNLVLDVSDTLSDKERYNFCAVIICAEKINPTQVALVERSTFGCKTYIIGQEEDLQKFIDQKIFYKDLLAEGKPNSNEKLNFTTEVLDFLDYPKEHYTPWSFTCEIYKELTKKERSSIDSDYARIIYEFCNNLACFIKNDCDKWTIYFPEISGILCVNFVSFIRQIYYYRKIDLHIVCPNENIQGLINRRF